MIKDCNTVKADRLVSNDRCKQTAKLIKAVNEERKQHYKEDLTKIPTHQSQKLLRKDDLRKMYPNFKDDNHDFFLKVLTQYMRISLGIISKEQLKRIRLMEELDRSVLVSRNIE